MLNHPTLNLWRQRPLQVVLALAAGLLLAQVPAQAQAQGGGAATAAQGRPTMAGTQGGMGAQPGLPQGGLTNQGNASQVEITLKRPGKADEQNKNMPQGEPAAAPAKGASAPVPDSFKAAKARQTAARKARRAASAP